ncbi:MAG: WD40 repeat domain-containing protein, partial [Cyanobacteria bacterium J06560_6]
MAGADDDACGSADGEFEVGDDAAVERNAGARAAAVAGCAANGGGAGDGAAVGGGDDDGGWGSGGWGIGYGVAQRVLLLVDQFEEVFTQCVEGKEKERDSFIEGLVAVGRAQTPLAVVMTMRSDFVNEWLATGQPPEVMNHDAVYLGPLKGEKLRAAIVEPARLQGYNVEPGLLTLLLDDVAKEENCLPLLEFTLQELWEERNAREKALTAMAYVKIGRLKGALDRQAERVFSEKLLREVDRDCARRVCLELVRIGPGGRDTRQRQPKEKLLRMDGESAEKQQVVADVVAELLKGRLLVSGGDEANAYVDVAHEALLEGWKRFVQWRQEGRALRQLLQRLEDAYGDWKEEQQESDEYLLSGGLLAELRERNVAINEALADGRPELMRYFSLSDEREQQKVAALEQALAKADIQEASRKVRDKLLFTPAQTVAATISAISLVGKSQDDFDGRVVYSSQDALHRAWFTIRERLKLEGHSSPVNSVAFSPEGDRIVSGSYDSTLRLWDLKGNAIGKPFEGHSGSVSSVAFSPKGDRIVSGSDDGTLLLWDLEGNTIGFAFEGHNGQILSVAFSPKGDRIVSGSYDNTLRLWDLEGNAIGSAFKGHNGRVLSVAFSPEGDRIVSGSYDNTLQLWDLEGNTVGATFEGHRGPVWSVGFSLQGDRIVSGSDDRTLRLWDLEGNAVGAAFEGHSNRVLSVAFSPEGDRIVSGSYDNTLRLWDLEGNAVGAALEGHENSVLS